MRTLRGWTTVLAAGALVLAIPAPGAGQGWIEPPVSVGRFSVEKVRSEVHVTVEGRIARVEVSEWFRNDGSRLAEGHYLYPLPGEAVFQGFSLFQGDAELTGEIMDAERARAIYEEIVRRRADPALIELAGHGLLRARVFPIQPGQERKVSLRYTQVLEKAGGALQLRYAGAVRGGRARREGLEPVGRPPAEAARTSFLVEVEDGAAFLDPFSPTHALEVRRDGGRLSVRVEEEPVGRLSLFLPLAGEDVGLAVATHRPVGEDGYVMLTLSPGRTDGPVQPRDVTVVLDVSGSMSGEKIGQAKEALRGLLATLDPEDRFRMVAFSNALRIHSEGWGRAVDADLAAARAWVDGLRADGGTNIGAALDEAFRLESPGDRLPVVLFLTDGIPSVGEESPERLADRAEARAGRARVFTFGVGHDVNTHLLDRLGEAGRGSTDYVEPGENVERAVGLLAAKIRHPVLTDVEIAGAPVRLEEIYPVRIPDVFAGEELVLFGRYAGEGRGAVRVRGLRSGRTAAFGEEASFPRATEANGYIPRLWASRKLGHLMRQVWTEGESKSLVEEIRTLALRYALPSPYTAYLVEEPGVMAFDSAARPRLRAMPAVVADASGAGAVRVAREARQLRAAASEEKLRRMEEIQQAEWEAGAAGRRVRSLAGRLFRLSDGVWQDVAHPQDGDVVRLKAFGDAWFRLMRLLPEIRPVLKELDRVVVRGGDVSLEVSPEGADELSEEALRDLVRRFRGVEPKR